MRCRVSYPSFRISSSNKDPRRPGHLFVQRFEIENRHRITRFRRIKNLANITCPANLSVASKGRSEWQQKYKVSRQAKSREHLAVYLLQILILWSLLPDPLSSIVVTYFFVSHPAGSSQIRVLL